MIRKALWLALLLVTLVPVTGCVVVVADETFAYLTRSEDRARAEAEELFAIAGRRMNFDRAWFSGPTRSAPFADYDTRSGNYTFEWRANPNFKDRISPTLVYWVSIAYLPYSREYFYDNDYSYYYQESR